MKYILKWSGIVAASLVVLIVIAAVALALFFPLDKIKELAAAELSKALHREVMVEKASFNIFTGLKLEKITITEGNKKLNRSFISADALELHYDLWPLLQRKVVIRKIGLDKPQVFIERSPSGDFNFSDLLAPQKPAEVKKEPAGGMPFELFVNSFYIKNGKLSYSDRATGALSSLTNLNVSVSGFELTMTKPIEFKVSSDLLYQGKLIPAALSGKVTMALAKEQIEVSPLALSIAGETANASVLVSALSKGPNVSLSLSSGKISVDPLLSIFAGTEKKSSKPVDMTAMVNQLTASIPGTLGLKASVDISNLTFQNFTIDKINLSAGLARKNADLNIKEIRFYGGTLSGAAKADLNVPGLAYSAKDLKLSGFDAHPFSNSVVDTFLTKLDGYKDLRDKVYGTLDINLSLSGRGVEPAAILRNLAGDAKLALKGAQIKRLKILASVGDLIKSNALKGDINIGELKADAGIRNSVVDVRKMDFAHNDISVDFKGGVDLNRLIWVAGNRLTLKLPPRLTSGLGKEYQLLRDSAGWLELTFELTGSLKLPIPKPILEKPVENLKKKVEEKAKAVIETEKVKVESTVTSKVSEETERLKKEAADKIKGLFGR